MSIFKCNLKLFLLHNELVHFEPYGKVFLEIIIIITDFTIVLCRWGEGGPVTKYSLRLAALSCSAYQALPNYNQKSYKIYS